MVQCCPSGCTSEPGNVNCFVAKVSDDLDVCVVVLILPSSRVVRPYFFDVVVAALVLYHVSMIMFRNNVNQRSVNTVDIVSTRTVNDWVTAGMDE